MRYTDKEMLDWLQSKLEESHYTGRCLFRWSSSGRGWRLHETSHSGAFNTVREALEVGMLQDSDTYKPNP